ncbi:MAG: patatin-like phospholipase family protein [Anaerolineaceae bacterium]|nr:patatin-like phospholipase family protein [Anaerolineaceae bacterium]
MELPDFVKKLKSKIDHELRKNLYKNLVFKGGGVRGIAYMGALEILDELGIVTNIQRVAGTSAGAIAATLVSFRLDIAETRDLFNTLDITRVPQSRKEGKELKFWQPKDNDCYARFFQKYGWYSSQYFHHWLEGIIAEQCDGNGRATFHDFQEYGFRDLYIVAANVSRQRPETFSVIETPDVSVADAVRMSMSIPIFFEALRFDGNSFGDGDYYVDGGMYDNFPMHIFDKPEFSSKPWAYRDGVNWETLGLFLFSDKYLSQSEPEIPENVWEFLMLTMRSMYNSHEISSYKTNPIDIHRSIEISDCGIKPVEFDIEQGSEKYHQLNNSGQQAVHDFFEL